MALSVLEGENIIATIKDENLEVHHKVMGKN